MRGRGPRVTRRWRRPPWRWSRRQQLTVGPLLGVALAGLAGLLVLLLLPLAEDNHDPAVSLPPEVTAGDLTPHPFRSPLIYPSPQSLTAARVLRVIDGDTLEVQVDSKTETVRYYGVDTPERDQPCFEEATAWNRALVGDEVRLLADVRDRDRFGRLLRYVFAPDGQSVDAAMVVAGVAIAWREDGVYKEAMLALEQSARQAEVGCLWRLRGNDEGN